MIIILTAPHSKKHIFNSDTRMNIEELDADLFSVVLLLEIFT